jgi:hypothetical protein
MPALLLGIVPPGGTPTFPGIILCALGLIGFLRLPVELKKVKSNRIAQLFLVAIDSVFLVVGAAMVYHGHFSK